MTVLFAIGIIFSILGLGGIAFLPKKPRNQRKYVLLIYLLLVAVVTLFYSLHDGLISDVGRQGALIIGLLMSIMVAGSVCFLFVLTLLVLNRLKR
jgi:cytochrome bd-type quinol oxidase subunit 1